MMSQTSTTQTRTSALPNTMRAWRWLQCCSTLDAALHLDCSSPLPTKNRPLAAGESLIQVHAAALNPVDYKLAELPVVGRMAIPKPATPGLDFSGRVVAVGSDARVKVGQMVFGKLEPKQQFGTLGEYIIGSREGTVPMPENLSAENAATLGVCGLVTYQALKKNIRTGDKVLVNGGSGGTGTFAIQIAKAFGCHVTTTCSGENMQICKKLGADVVLNYYEVDVPSQLAKQGQKFDFILDNVGSPSELYWKAPSFTKPGAKYVQIGSQVSLGFIYDLAFRFIVPSWLGGGQRPFSFGFASTNYEDYMSLIQLVAERMIQPVVDRVVDLEEVPEAYQYLKTGRAKGKIVVRVRTEEIKVGK